MRTEAYDGLIYFKTMTDTQETKKHHSNSSPTYMCHDVNQQTFYSFIY